MKQRAEITYEEQETLILRDSESHAQDFCPRCQAMVRFLTPQILAASVAVSEREVFRMIEEGQIHFVETPRVYACLDCCLRTR